ncbi:uncharacterized protein [Rutidosis leptorrhynchoides]|uniref:uncharacterized protein isoform X3 n=1 Tax=Rutidosis leptorrhynchoides TaxID=125765 RepID=UPI003A9A5D95
MSNLRVNLDCARGGSGSTTDTADYFNSDEPIILPRKKRTKRSLDPGANPVAGAQDVAASAQNAENTNSSAAAGGQNTHNENLSQVSEAGSQNARCRLIYFRKKRRTVARDAMHANHAAEGAVGGVAHNANLNEVVEAGPENTHSSAAAVSRDAIPVGGLAHNANLNEVVEAGPESTRSSVAVSRDAIPIGGLAHNANLNEVVEAGPESTHSSAAVSRDAIPVGGLAHNANLNEVVEGGPEIDARDAIHANVAAEGAVGGVAHNVNLNELVVAIPRRAFRNMSRRLQYITNHVVHIQNEVHFLKEVFDSFIPKN